MTMLSSAIRSELETEVAEVCAHHMLDVRQVAGRVDADHRALRYRTRDRARSISSAVRFSLERRRDSGEMPRGIGSRCGVKVMDRMPGQLLQQLAGVAMAEDGHTRRDCLPRA